MDMDITGQFGNLTFRLWYKFGILKGFNSGRRTGSSTCAAPLHGKKKSKIEDSDANH